MPTFFSGRKYKYARRAKIQIPSDENKRIRGREWKQSRTQMQIFSHESISILEVCYLKDCYLNIPDMLFKSLLFKSLLFKCLFKNFVFKACYLLLVACHSLCARCESMHRLGSAWKQLHQILPSSWHLQGESKTCNFEPLQVLEQAWTRCKKLRHAAWKQHLLGWHGAKARPQEIDNSYCKPRTCNCEGLGAQLGSNIRWDDMVQRLVQRHGRNKLTTATANQEPVTAKGWEPSLEATSAGMTWCKGTAAINWQQLLQTKNL